MTTTKIVKHLVIHGHVQGVFFRDSMRHEAMRLEVSGWVRNRSDGCVEAMVQGVPASVEAMLEWAHHGPSQARVTRVEVEPGDGGYEHFAIVG